MILTLCGSSRFEPWFHLWNMALGLAGHSVFGLCSYPSAHDGLKNWYTPEDKIVLDRVHKDKILASDAVLILNAFAYLGESTLSELDAALAGGKKVYMLESWGKGCGVGDNHFESHRRAAMTLGVWGTRSPRDATVGPYLYPFDLLGPAGERRTRLVALVQSETDRIVASLSADFVTNSQCGARPICGKCGRKIASADAHSHPIVCECSQCDEACFGIETIGCIRTAETRSR